MRSEEQSEEEIPVEKAVKNTVEKLQEIGFSDNHDISDEVLKIYLFIEVKKKKT